MSHNYTHIPFIPSLPPLHPSHPSMSSQSTRLGSLCYIETSHQLILGCVYMLMLLSPFILLSLSPLQCPQIHSLHLCLHSFPANRSMNTIFQIPCICVNTLFLFFSLLLTSLCITGSSFIHLTGIDSNSFFLWLSNIPLFIRTTSSLSIHLQMNIQVASMPWLF